MFDPSLFRLNITSRLILVCLVMGLIPLVVAGIFGMSISVSSLQENITQNLKSNAKMQVRQVEDKIDRVTQDVIFLSSAPSIKRFLLGEPGGRDEMEKHLLQFNRLHPEYYQIRFLGSNGAELIRSNHKEGAFYLTPLSSLQYKGGRYYFKEGIKSNKGEVYFSHIDLNIEHSIIEEPLQLVARISTPVYLNGVIEGLIIVNLSVDAIFDWVRAPNTPFSTLFVNEKGEVMYIAKNGKPDGRVGEVGVHISDIFPSFTSERIQTKPAGIETFGMDIVAFSPIRGEGKMKTPSWYLITLYPKTSMTPYMAGMILNLLYFLTFVAFIGIFIGLYLARRLIGPIKKLHMEADLIANGYLDNPLLLNTGDEIGELAEKFDSMRVQVKEKQARLSDWNLDLNRQLESRVVEIRDLEKQLHRADKLASLGELSMKLAHEIGNPLASIKTVAQVMDEEVQDHLECGNSANQSEYLQRIVSEVDRLNAFLKNFNKFAVIKEAEPVLCDLTTIISEVCLLLKVQAHESGVTLEEYYDPELEEIMIDPQQVKQILINLMLNAIHACERRGRVKVSLKNVFSSCKRPMRKNCFCMEEGKRIKAESFIEMSVCDNGKGIPDKDLIKIFDPYYSTKSDGTGLGLSIVHRIIEKHNGKIRVYSEIDEGTTFKIYFPKQSVQALSHV